MSDIGDILKPIIGGAWQSDNPAREAVTQLYALGIEKIIDEKPQINRHKDRTVITWKPGQAKKMQKYVASLIMPGKKDEPKSTRGFQLNEVQVDMKPIIVPLAMKTILPFMGTYTFLVWYLSRRTKRRK